MAKDRHDADMALAHTTTKMNSALAAAKALQDSRFAQSVADIASAKKEANDRVNSFKKSFKMDIMHLSSVVDRARRQAERSPDHPRGYRGLQQAGAGQGQRCCV